MDYVGKSVGFVGKSVGYAAITHTFQPMKSIRSDVPWYKYIILIARVSMRYGEIFHEPKASEMYRNISHEMNVTSDLSYIDGKCARSVERKIATVKYHRIACYTHMEKYYRKYIKYRIYM